MHESWMHDLRSDPYIFAICYYYLKTPLLCILEDKTYSKTRLGCSRRNAGNNETRSSSMIKLSISIWSPVQEES